MDYRNMVFPTKAALYAVLTPFLELHADKLRLLRELDPSRQFVIGDLPVGPVFRSGRTSFNEMECAYILCNESETRWRAVVEMA